MKIKNDVIIAFKKANREIQFERNGGGHFVSVNRPHKNKKKYNRKRDKKNFDFDLSLFFFAKKQFININSHIYIKINYINYGK